MLRAMTTALIVIGVILFLLLDAYIIARVFRSRATADDYASIAVPGETTWAPRSRPVAARAAP
jgi:hypothetical protein